MIKFTIIEGNSNDKDNVRVLMVKGEKGDTGNPTKLSQLENDTNFVPRNEIDEQIDAVNVNLSSQIRSLASGSPLVASSISEMTNTTKIYVNTTDGYWYYYNGSAWVQGGVYQSTGLGKNEVTMYNLDNYINNSVDGVYIDLAGTIEYGKYLDTDGTIKSVATTAYKILTANLNGGENLKFKTGLQKNLYAATVFTYAIYDSSNIMIAHDEITPTSNLSIEYDIQVPDNARKIIINNTDSYVLYLVKASTYKQKNKISYDDLDNDLKTKFNLNYGTIKEKITLIQNAFVTLAANGANINFAAAQGYNIVKVPITPGKRYLLKNLIGFYNMDSYVITSSCKSNYTVGGTTYNNLDTPCEGYNPEESGYDTLLADKYITAPDYATYLYINTSSVNSSLLQVIEADTVLNNELIEKDVLYGKKYVACGDSWTHGDFTGYTGEQSDIYDSEWEMYKTYPYWIGKRNNMNIVNSGINGSIMALDKTYVDSPSTVNINTNYPFSYQRYQQIPNDADYITIMFGLNDMFHTYLGAINDNTNASFYGAGNVVLSYLIEHYPDAKIGIIVSNSYLSNEYRQALIDLAIKWGVGYLDLYNDTSITKTLGGNGMGQEAITLKNSLYQVSNNNSHPNVRAHKIMSHAIEDFLRKL